MNAKQYPVTRRLFLPACALASLFTLSAPAQESNPPAPSAPTAQKADSKTEMTTADTAPTFKVRVNLVQARVVVRDGQGNPVPGLTQEDFHIFDNGKLQAISHFSVETPKSRAQRVEDASAVQTSTDGTLPAEHPTLPQRFIALLFDDSNISLSDANFVHKAAFKFLDSTAPTDRVGVYTTSGQVTQEFTSDKNVLREAVQRIIPRGLFQSVDCPEVTYYMANLIENTHDTQAFNVVVQEALICEFGGDSSKIAMATQSAQIAVRRALSQGELQNQMTFRHIEDALGRVASMPGERILLLVSPGFLVSKDFLDEMGIIDRATRASTVINTLDVRGLYTIDALGDVSKPNSDTFRTVGLKGTYRTTEQLELNYVLADFASGTGGIFFHNRNDLDVGLKQLGNAPEVAYLLAFSPQNLKNDGAFHNIQVKLTGKRKYSVQARKGYYAPKHTNNPEEQAKQEIQEAIFSQEELTELPLQLQTQFFKKDETEARLSVVSHLDVRQLPFRKAEGRNLDTLIVATAIFDENGNFVTGGEKILEMKLLDATYDRMSHNGLSVKSSFDVKPGKYMIRQVVRDAEGTKMAARNGAIVIPY